MTGNKPTSSGKDSGPSSAGNSKEILPRVLATIRSEHDTVIQLIKDKEPIYPDAKLIPPMIATPTEHAICYKIRYWEIDTSEMAYSCVVSLWEHEAMDLTLELLKVFGLAEQIQNIKQDAEQQSNKDKVTGPDNV